MVKRAIIEESLRGCKLENDYLTIFVIFEILIVRGVNQIKSNMITIEFNKENSELTIKSSQPIADFSKLMDDLGDHDVVQANEIKQNFIAFDGLVYELDDNSIDKLSKDGQVSLSLEGNVKELGDEDFNNWYYNN